MHFFNTHISSRIILKLMLGLAAFGMIFILLSVHRMNSVFSTDLGFDKDSVVSLKTIESPFVLKDTFVFSSELPGFRSKQHIDIVSESDAGDLKIAHQYISSNYFDFFNYKKITEDINLFSDYSLSQLVYVNRSALQKLGIEDVKKAPGTVLLDKNQKELVICGVVENYYSLAYDPINQAKIFQLTSEHLAYAFINKWEFEQLVEKKDVNISSFLSFQQRIEKRNKIYADLIYSGFFFLNMLILLICMGYVGVKYARRKETELFAILGIGIHVITLLISKTYIYLIAIMAGIIGPVAFIIQKFWLGIYANRINFGWFNLFIILTMAVLTVYLICCPKEKIEEQFSKRPV